MVQFYIYTAGHGQMDWDSFAPLLTEHSIEVLIDVRSWPYFEPAPWFNRDPLEEQLRRRGIEYRWFGAQLGPLTENGKVDYLAKEREARYHEGIKELMDIASERRTCILASQVDPMQSHRHHLITQTLLRYDIGVRHILESGGVSTAQPDLFHHSLSA